MLNPTPRHFPARSSSRWIAGITAAAVVSFVASGIPTAQAAEPQHDRIVSADPANFTPDVESGKVDSMVQIGNRIIAVGKFSQVTPVGGPTVTRNNIFAFNATSGALDASFTPNVGTQEVSEVVDAGNGTVYIGGAFTSVNGTATPGHVAQLSATTGTVVAAFKAPKANGAINDMQMVNNKLYIGGSFTTLGTSPRTLLAALNLATGADTGTVNLTFAGLFNGGGLTVKHFDISDNGATLVAVGNWRTVNGQTRTQIVMADLTGINAVLSDWATDRYEFSGCASVFDTYMRDADIAPSGDYFVVAATGAFAGGVDSGTLCDTATRWEIGPSNNASGQQPSWVDYSGGDTLTQIKVTGPAVYVGGHFRWMNNPYVGDAVGPGAVPREGLATLDPRNGLPFTWNPGRARGVGVWEFLPTTAGLWIGSDTNRIGGEIHKRIALMPLAGQNLLPAENTGSLPGDVFLLGEPAGTTNGHWVARVNAAGPTQLATDSGPDWAADTADQPSPNHNGGSNTADWGGLPITRDASLPASTPTSIFTTERWSPSDFPPMEWDFAATVGHSLEVRLYFSNGYSGTQNVGDRVFDVAIDGTLKLDDYDIVADAGATQRGVMQSFTIVSDGNVDIDFSHVNENPLINGVEIIDNDVAPPAPGTNDTVRERDFNGDDVTGTSSPGTGGQAWGNSRGAVMINGTLYTGWSDGTFKARTYNGTTFGTARNVNLYSSSFANDVSNITAMFYDRSTARLYYTMAGQSSLFYRYFLPQSEVVGAVQYEALGNIGDVDWSDASGLLLDGSDLYIGSRASGDLARMDWNAGDPSGTLTTVSGPSIDTYDWRARGTFVYAG